MRRYSYVPPIIVICLILGLAVARNLRRGDGSYSDAAIMMGTVVEISVWGDGRMDAAGAVSEAFGEIARVESLFGCGMVSPEAVCAVASSPAFIRLMEVSETVYAGTGGLFDPTIGAVTRLWQYGDGAVPPPADSITTALRHVGFGHYLESGPDGFILDLGGVAKGYAVDLAADRLTALGFKSAIINAGGDLRLIGRPQDGEPWRIAIRHPRHPGEFVGYLDLDDGAVATSGDYERFFIWQGRRFHHILDPRTGLPGQACESVTIVSPLASTGDALATGCFLMGPHEGLNLVEGLDRTEAVFVFADGESVLVSSGLAGHFGRLDAE
jgi:thiamine biosynthesis lipoprotein